MSSGPIADHVVLDHPVHRAPGCPLDPPPGYTAGLGEGPMRRLRLWNGFTPWLVTRHADVRAVLADARFSADVRRPEFPLLNPATPTVRTGQSFLRMDDPDHRRLRHTVSGELRAGASEALRPQVQALVDGLLARLEGLPQPVDLVAELAAPLPALVICLLLGVPTEDRDTFAADSTRLMDLGIPDAERAAAGARLVAYLTELVARKAAEPGDDLLSRLVRGPEAAGELTRAELVTMTLLLLVAGHETTANQISLSVLALLQDPAQAAAVRADDGLVPGAVEELLRHLTVTQAFVARVATEDVVVGENDVRAGDGVFCIVAAANRDPAQFPDPDTLDVHRDARRHLAFGFGVHQCLGQTLARVELQVVLGTLLRRLPGLALAVPGDALEFKDRSVFYGVRTLPVTF